MTEEKATSTESSASTSGAAKTATGRKPAASRRGARATVTSAGASPALSPLRDDPFQSFARIWPD
jgi:hypothetical protein